MDLTGNPSGCGLDDAKRMKYVDASEKSKSKGDKEPDKKADRASKSKKKDKEPEKEREVAVAR